MSWPDLDAADQGARGGSVGLGGGISRGGQPAYGDPNFVDEEIPDAVGNPLPQLPRSLPPQSAHLPELVSNYSGGDEDEDHLEDGPEWYLDDTTPLNPLGVNDNFSETSIDDPEPIRRSATENRGMHPKQICCCFCCQLGK